MCTLSLALLPFLPRGLDRNAPIWRQKNFVAAIVGPPGGGGGGGLYSIEGDPLNTQHAQHRGGEETVFIRGVNTNEDPPKEGEEEDEEEVVFTQSRGSAQHATRATPTQTTVR